MTISKAPNRSPSSSPASCYDVPCLLQLFESLGENCDLGVVQRAVGLEPFGLFRFAACDASGVAALLRARFEPLCVAGDLWLDVVGAEREYWLKSRSSRFEAHTNRYADRDAAAVVLQGEIEKMRYLTAHLLQDLSQGRKLCVFKGPSDLATIREVAAALQAHGPNCLLWVKVADLEHAPGSVQRDSEVLLLGYVSHYGTYDGAPSLPVEEWVAMCANAYRLWRNEDAPRVRCDNLISDATASGSCLWVGDPLAETRSRAEPSLAGGVRYQHRLGCENPTVVFRAQLLIAYGGRLTFSTWLRIPEGSELRMIGLRLDGFATDTTWAADLKSRGRWQRVWLAAEVPVSVRTVACDLIASGAAGAEFDSANWCLERAPRPSGYGFVL
jgi:hypothetical protein